MPPTLYQTYGDNQWIAPNYDLKPETNESHEINISFGKQNKNIVFNGSIYRRFQKNALEYEYNTASPSYEIYTNIDGLRTQGLEAGIDTKFNSFVKLRRNLSLVEKKTHDQRSSHEKITQTKGKFLCRNFCLQG